jgi:hypothetical protein
VTPSPPPTTADDAIAPRLPASAVPSITGLRIKPHGADATLVNISQTGLLAECRERIQPGSNVTLAIEGTFTPQSIAGRVVRNSVSSLGADGRLRYHIAIGFNQRIPLVGEVPPVEVPAPSVDPAGSTPIVSAVPAGPAVPAAPAVPAVPLRNRW